ncbi:hypothetical protein [Arachidicoccus sp.]|uniref:hypothetical protein n=1 Tax=Arachidicoccus sp. TaxID=1872624 RepID=UPI003D257863
MSKTIILGQTTSFLLSTVILENLRYCGFNIIDISFDEDRFKYRNYRQRAHNFFRKTFLGDKRFKVNLRINDFEEGILKKIDLIEGKAEFALLIRPDMYSDKILLKLKSKAKLLIGYQWDGLNRFPTVFGVINYFDRFFVFDSNDLNYRKKELLYLTNFYFDLPEILNIDEKIEEEIYFVFTYSLQRLNELNLFLDKIATINIKKNIFVYVKNKELSELNNKIYTPIAKTLTYKENIRNVKKASVLLDFNNRIHNGLSFRTFEAICFEKKLVTNNKTIKHFDFYHPQNVFVLGEDDEQNLSKFMKSDYIKIDERIKKKYCFSNWINFVLDIQPNTPITLADMNN